MGCSPTSTVLALLVVPFILVGVTTINQCSAEVRAAQAGVYLRFTCLGNPVNQVSPGKQLQFDDVPWL